MEARGTNGKSSETCNDDILAGWTNACNAAYGLPDLGTATTPATAWGQVFGSGSSGNNATTYGSDITTRLYCQATCVTMAKASYLAMKTNTSGFPVEAYVPITANPFQGSSQSSPFTAEVLGVGKEAQSYVLANWTDATKTLFQLTLKAGYLIHYYISPYILNLDEDYLFGYAFEEGDFSTETNVNAIVLELHDGYGYAGLAIRNNNEKGSPSALLVVAKEGKLIFRAHAAGETTTEIDVPVKTSLPMNLKPARIGPSVSAYYKIGTGNWISIGSHKVGLDKVVKRDLCVPYWVDTYSDGSVPHNAAFFKSIIVKKITSTVPMISSLLLN